MSARLASTSNLARQEHSGHLRIEFGYVTVTELAELFRALAVTCVQRQANRLLVIAGDDEPTGERALRDALTIMILAGIPPDMRLAMVPGSPKVAQTYRHAERDFSAAGITTRLFDTEEDAVRWLEGGSSSGAHQPSA